MADQWAEGCVTGAHELHVEVLKKRIYLTSYLTSGIVILFFDSTRRSFLSTSYNQDSILSPRPKALTRECRYFESESTFVPLSKKL